MALGEPNGFTGASDFGAPANGLNGAGTGDPKGEDWDVEFARNGFVVEGDGALLKGSNFCSVDVSANRTCLLVYGPPWVPRPPRPLTIVPFCPLCVRFAAFSSRSRSNGFGELGPDDVPVCLKLE